MKAIGYTHAQFGLPIENPNALAEIPLPDPAPQGRDILVEVRAVSVNPVDTKVRRGSTPAAGEVKVLGWDAVGVVRATGAVMPPLVILAIGMWGIRLPFANLLQPALGADAIWWSFPISAFCSMLAIVAYYRFGGWRKAQQAHFADGASFDQVFSRR